MSISPAPHIALNAPHPGIDSEPAPATTPDPASTLERSPAARAFVLHWGEMGSRWGINRTVAQVHALLYLSPDPLPADAIAQTLGVARSNVSTSIRELIGWGIVHPVPVLGQRKDHFTAMADVWQMFKVILDERKKRELDPTLALLNQCMAQAREELAASTTHAHASPSQEHAARHTLARIEAMTDLLTTMTGWYGQVRGLPTGAVRRFMTMGTKVVGLFGRTPKHENQATPVTPTEQGDQP
ncbi:MAG: ArsR family transcriptional regulator [Planctomycetota bacterium]